MPDDQKSDKELPEPWFSFLAEVDQVLTEPVEVQCLGGFVLTILYEVPRVTGDLDYIVTLPNEASERLEQVAGRESKLAGKHRLHFQRVGGVVDLPENYEDRLQELSVNLKKLRLKVLEPYDLILSKLSRNSQKDREDVKFLARQLGLEFAVAYERFEKEMKPWMPNADRHEQTLNVVWKEYFSK
jgi:hypothetical protein